jgi:hypothetical protein
MNFKLTATQIGIRMSRSKLFIRCQRFKKKNFTTGCKLVAYFSNEKEKNKQRELSLVSFLHFH